MDTPGEMKADAKHAARKVEDSPALRWLARAGYVANGVVHALVGIIALIVAFGGKGESDQAGALKAIAAAPLGFAALWALGIALCALGAWHAAEGLLAHGARDDPKGTVGAKGTAGADCTTGADGTVGAKGTIRKWGRRLAEWGQAVVFVALGLIAAAVAAGARPSGDQAVEIVSRGILSLPGGPYLLGLIGLSIGGGGVAFVAMGVLRSFEKRIDVPDGALGATVRGLGIVGFVAKGLALIVVGVLLVIAAVQVDAETAAGLDGAMRALLALPIGHWIAGLVGVGFLAYAVFCAFRARYARL